MTFKVSNNLALLAMLMTGLHDANAEDPTNEVTMTMGNIRSGESVWVDATKSKYRVHLRLVEGLEAKLNIEYWNTAESEIGECIWHEVEVDCNDPDTWIEPMIILQNVLDGKCEPEDPCEE